MSKVTQLDTNNRLRLSLTKTAKTLGWMAELVIDRR
jgi:hypothetical protein